MCGLRDGTSILTELNRCKRRLRIPVPRDRGMLVGVLSASTGRQHGQMVRATGAPRVARRLDRVSRSWNVVGLQQVRLHESSPVANSIP